MTTKNRIVTLYEDANKTEVICPKTLTKAVTNEQGENLDTLLNSSMTKKEYGGSGIGVVKKADEATKVTNDLHISIWAPQEVEGDTPYPIYEEVKTIAYDGSDLKSFSVDARDLRVPTQRELKGRIQNRYEIGNVGIELPPSGEGPAKATYELRGSGEWGYFRVTQIFTKNDAFSINGKEVPAYAGAYNFFEAYDGQDLRNRWLTFYYDGTALNFAPAGGSGGGQCGYSKLVPSSATYSVKINANVFYEIITPVSELNITFEPLEDVYAEYMFTFKTAASGCSLVLPGTVMWSGDKAPTLTGNKKYEVSVLNNLAVISGGVAL